MKRSEQALAIARVTFAARARPAQWLLPDLWAVDRVDGEEFIEQITAGSDPREFLRSAIPYFDFLTLEAARYLLPYVFEIIIEETTNLVNFLPSFTLGHGKDVFQGISVAERQSLRSVIYALRTEVSHPLEIAMLTELEAVVDGKPTSIEKERTQGE